MKPISLEMLSSLLEKPSILKELVKAHRHLAELKGIAKTIPNQGILLSTLSLQEAKDSSEIENIITTQDALYKYPPDHSNRNSTSTNRSLRITGNP